MSFIGTETVDFAFLSDTIWWLRVSFSSDFFDKLNELNLSLQGAQENFITICAKLKAFDEKLDLWNSKIINSNYGSFPAVNLNPSKSKIKNEIEETLKALSESFLKYYPYLDSQILEMEWVVNPFIRCELTNLDEEVEDNLIDFKKRSGEQQNLSIEQQSERIFRMLIPLRAWIFGTHRHQIKELKTSKDWRGNACMLIKRWTSLESHLQRKTISSFP